MDDQQARAEKVFKRSDKPSEDMSRHWQYKKSPSFDEYALYRNAGKWCLYVPPVRIDATWQLICDTISDDRKRLVIPSGIRYERVRAYVFTIMDADTCTLIKSRPVKDEPIVPIPLNFAPTWSLKVSNSACRAPPLRSPTA